MELMTVWLMYVPRWILCATNTPKAQGQGSYAKHFHVIDRNDRDSADYTVSIRTNRLYMRVFFWIVDRVVHCMFVVVVICAKDNVGLGHFI
jgi:hypothetical protein